MNKISFIMILLFFIYSNSIANPSTYDLENYFEKISAQSPQLPISDNLENYKNNKINLYKTNVEELSYLPLMSPLIAKRIINYLDIDKYPTYDNLRVYNELTESQMEILFLYTTLGEVESPIKGSYRFRNFTSLSTVNGTQNNRFLGDELDYLQKLNLVYNSTSLNILSTKDMGEESYVDFICGNLSYTDDKFKLLLGDYTIESGSGSILWRAMGVRKGSSVLAPIVQQGSGIKPYNSGLEYGFFRGLAGLYVFNINDSNSIKITSFYSDAPHSGSIDINNEEYVTSVYTMGYYRTPSELKRKNNFNEKAIGGIAEYQFNNLNIGFNVLSLNYNKEILSSSLSAFQGKSGVLTSAFMNYANQGNSFSIEIANDNNGKLSGIGGYLAKYNNFNIGVNARYYSLGFNSPYGNNFSEFSIPTNEMGIYTGISYHATQDLTLHSYLDIYKSVGLVNNSFIRMGTDLFIEGELKLNKIFMLYLRYKTENKTQSRNNNDLFYENYQVFKSNYRIELQSKPTKNSKIRMRYEHTHLNYENQIQPSQFGHLIFLEISHNFFDDLELGTRLYRFNIESFEAAIYPYEYYFQGYMYSPAAFGNGSRGVFFAKYKVHDNLNLNLRVNINKNANETEIGDGLTNSITDTQARMYFQLDYKF